MSRITLDMPASIRITEVGPRDGLQNEREQIRTSAKIDFVNRLSRSGVAEIEVSSFVSPKWVPQLADAGEVFAAIERVPGVCYSALVPNERGFDRALEANVDRIAVFTAASEAFSTRNVNASISASLERFKPVVQRAKSAGLPVRGYISCAIACPYDGPTNPAQVTEVTRALLDLGVDEIDLGDTIGVAVPTDIDRLFEALQRTLAPEDATLHLHDTRGTALACAHRAMQLGVRSFDGSCGGVGGCPFAPGASGNLATEDLVYLAGRSGVDCGIDLNALLDAAEHIQAALRRPLTGRVFAAERGGSPGPCDSQPTASS